MKNFVIRAVVGVVFVAVMVGAIVWRADSMILLFAIITGLSIWEFCGLVNQIDDVQTNRFISTVAGVYFFLAVAALQTGLASNFVVFVPYVLTMLYLLVSEHYNWLLPLSLFIFLWANDTGAYCVGSLLGRHKLFPRVSPGKSWEGSIGGGVIVMAVAALIAYLTFESTPLTSHPLPFTTHLLSWIGLGLVVVVFGTWGDLVESLFKRTLGIKDSGNILPGHGGMLDRFDSSLLAIPAAVVYLYTLTLI